MRTRSGSRTFIIVTLVVLCTALSMSGTTSTAASAHTESPADSPLEWVGAGQVTNVYDPGATEQPARYINDHTLIKAPDGTWHMFGITAPKAPDGLFPDGAKEINLAHATAPSITGPWTTKPYALTVDPNYFGEAHLWAPDVVAYNGTYYMFYAAGGDGAAIDMAVSTDLYNWSRIPSGPLFRGTAARDPDVVRVGNQWVMYYCEIGPGQHHVVAYRTSTDLLHWGAQQIAFTDPSLDNDSASVTESPVVVWHNGWWYLFIGPRGGYVGTDVFRSHNPLNFSVVDYAGHIPVHAAEVVRDGAQWWISGAGSFQDGLYLAPLHWQNTPPLWQNARNPASVLDSTNRIELFALNQKDHTVIRRVEVAANTGVWGSWEPFGVAAGAVPTVVRDANGRLELFVPSPDGSVLWQRVQTVPASDIWGPWERFGAAVGAPPTVGSYADGRLAVFALGPSGTNITYRLQSSPGSDSWQDWQPFGGPAGAPPTVGTDSNGGLEVFAVGPAGAYLAHRWQTTPNGGWSGWDATFGGPAAAAQPAVAHDADGRLEVFAAHPVSVGTGERFQSTPGGGWSDWVNFGTVWPDATPEVAANVDGRLEAFYIEPGGDYLVHSWQTAPNGSWSTEQRFDDGFPSHTVACTPNVAIEADGRLMVLALASDGSLNEREQTAPGSGWGAWTSFGSTRVAIPSCGAPT